MGGARTRASQSPCLSPPARPLDADYRSQAASAPSAPREPVLLPHWTLGNVVRPGGTSSPGSSQRPFLRLCPLLAAPPQLPGRRGMDLQWPRVVSHGTGARDDASQPPTGSDAIGSPSSNSSRSPPLLPLPPIPLGGRGPGTARRRLGHVPVVVAVELAWRSPGTRAELVQGRLPFLPKKGGPRRLSRAAHVLLLF